MGVFLMPIPRALSNTDLLTIVGAICTYVLPLPIFFYLMKKLDKCEIEKHKMGLFNFIIAIGITLALMWIGNLIGLGFIELISVFIKSKISNPIADLIDNSNIWINIIIISIIAPIVEEFIFRKLLIDRTIIYGEFLSILLSALLFGLFHGNLNQFFYAFLIGGFFAYIYIKTGKIIYTIILHMITNFSGSVLGLFIGEILTNMSKGVATSTFDSVIAVIYMLMFFALILIGIIFLIKDRKKFTFKKKEIEKPYSTAFLNLGMILFIGYCLIEIVLSILG